MTRQSARYQQHDKAFKEYVVQMYLGQGGFNEVYQVVNDIGLPFALRALANQKQLYGEKSWKN